VLGLLDLHVLFGGSLLGKGSSTHRGLQVSVYLLVFVGFLNFFFLVATVARPGVGGSLTILALPSAPSCHS
jgi:hypothetical protein